MIFFKKHPVSVTIITEYIITHNTHSRKKLLKDIYIYIFTSQQMELCGGSQCGQPTPDKCVAFKKDSDFTCFFRENAFKQEQEGCDWHRDISICS